MTAGLPRLFGILLLGTAAALPMSSLAAITLGVHTEEPAPAIGELIAAQGIDGEIIELQSFESSMQVLQAIGDGSIDLGIVEDSGHDDPAVTLVAELYPSVLHMLHRQTEPPGSVGELLASGPIWAGPPGSIGYRVAGDIGRDFSLPTGHPELLDGPWVKEPEIYFVFGGILAPDALFRLPGFSLYSLDDPGALMQGSVAEGVALRYPYLHPFVLPAQLYPQLGRQAALTLAVSNVLVARASLDERTVYELAMMVERLQPHIAAVYPMASLTQLADSSSVPRALALHPGARRYRDRDLPGFLERNAEVLGLFATLVIASGSVLVAWQRQRRQSRKDTLDTYYQKLLELRARLADGANPTAIAGDIRATQAEVMTLVIEERIDADGSLLAFLTLSNQLLDESDPLPGPPVTT